MGNSAKEVPMKIPTLLPVIPLLLLGGLFDTAEAQSGQDLLQQALVMERAEGNLDGAVILYNRILEEHTGDRALCARALFQMASFFERLGRPEAIDVFRRVMEEYPDQAEEAREARTRLEAAAGSPTRAQPTSEAPDPTFTLLLEDELPFGQGAGGTSLSPDGRRLLLWIRGRGVYLFDPVTALPRHILPLRDPAERVNMARWSPDGTRIAVLHLTRTEEGGPLGESILIIDPEGNEISRLSIRTSPGDPRGWYHYSLAWTPDQQALTYARQGGIYSITLDGRETELTPEGSVGGVPMLGGYSPDGRWLAYSTSLPGDAGRDQFDVWVMPASGGSARKLTHHPDMDLTPAWGADGLLYFSSARSGSRNIWRIRIHPDSGERVGDPEQVTFFQDSQVAWPSPATEGGKMAFILWGARETVRVADVERPGNATTLARGTAISLSPDGTRLLYRFELNNEAAVRVRSDAIYSIPTSGGAPIRLSPESHAGIRYAGFSVDGSRVEYHAATPDGPSEFQVPATGGEGTLLRRIVPIQMPDVQAFRLSPDRSVAVFFSGSGLYSWPLSGGVPTLLAEAPGWQGEIEFSPDGRYLAANGSQRSSQGTESFWPSDVYLVSLEGGEARRLTSDAERTEKFWLAWHPDGEHLTYNAMDREGYRTTRMAYLDGRPTILFHDEPGVRDGQGCWAPDGEDFFFVGNGNTYRRNPDGGVDLLWEGQALPIVSADGAIYAFTHNAISAQLWLMENFR
jgi:Tol biopolymer transport system component